MTCEGAFASHVFCRECNRFPNTHMARFTAIHQAGVGHVYLLDLDNKVLHLPKKAIYLKFSQPHEVVSEIFILLLPQLCGVPCDFRPLRKKLSLEVFVAVVFPFQLGIIETYPIGPPSGCGQGELERSLLDFRYLLFQLVFRRQAGGRFHFISEGCDLPSGCLKHVAQSRNSLIDQRDLIINLPQARNGSILGRLDLGSKLLEFKRSPHGLLRRSLLWLDTAEIGGVQLDKTLLVALPWPQAVVLVIEGPYQRGDKQKSADHKRPAQ